MANTIVLKTIAGQYDEAVAVGAITPGMLGEIDSAGKIKAHATEGGYAERVFAIEDGLQGNVITDEYSIGDIVKYFLAVPGDVVNVLVKAGETLSIGEKVVSGGNGTVVAADNVSSGTTNYQIIGYMMEAVDLSASGAVATRGKLRVL